MWWLLVGVIIVIAYCLLRNRHRHWMERGVKQGNPKFIVGDLWQTIVKTKSMAEVIETVYNKFSEERYSGFYQFLIPVLFLRDPDLIKQITVKDFDHFVDHSTFVPEDAEPLWAKNLFSLTGKRWREMRSTLSPAFTSSKMKFMFSLISKSGEQFVGHFLKKEEDVVVMEMKDTFSRFANDVIASTAFGIECDSLEDRDNKFYLMGKEATFVFGFWKTIKCLGFYFFPRVSKFFKLTLISQRAADFFNRVVRTNIESREKHGIIRPDMIHLLLEARKNGLKYEDSQPNEDTGFATVEESEIGKSSKTQKREITDQDITSQVLVFFFAGFDGVAALMCFMSYELAINPDIQKRLIQEIDKTLEACKGHITYELLLGMKYLDMVVCETLRKWPMTVAVDRVCTKPYTIRPKYPHEKPVHLEKNALLSLPIFGIHRDPRHYPEPERFDPERFSDENKDKIKPCTYLPFGSGPRNCIGSRFALLETKTLFFYLLANFEIVPVEKTQIPLRICKKAFNLAAEGGFWLGLKRRVKT